LRLGWQGRRRRLDGFDNARRRRRDVERRQLGDHACLRPRAAARNQQ
jgi:hypothetical protein